MKKTYLYLTLIAFASFSLASCNDDEKDPATESGIVGTWEGDADEYHYPVATINADGTYVWEWTGIAKYKDVGKYTYTDNKIVMNATAYYAWDDKEGGYIDNKYIEENIPRKIKILDLTPGVMRVELSDYIMGEGYGFDYILYRKGLVQDIKTKDLEGTWESYESDGTLAERVIISGSKYTAYEVWTSDTILCAAKSTGTWSVKDNVMTVKPSENLLSYERVNNDDVYSVVDPETLEAEKWTVASWTDDEYTQRIYLSADKKTLYAAGAVFKKK